MSLSTEYHRKVVSKKNEDHKFKHPIKPARLMEPYEEDELARALKEFISIDKDLEGIKQILSLKTDFNLEDAYKIFDLESKDAISLRELEEGYAIYKLFPPREELHLLMQRFD